MHHRHMKTFTKLWFDSSPASPTSQFDLHYLLVCIRSCWVKHRPRRTYRRIYPCLLHGNPLSDMTIACGYFRYQVVPLRASCATSMVCMVTTYSWLPPPAEFSIFCRNRKCHLERPGIISLLHFVWADGGFWCPSGVTWLSTFLLDRAVTYCNAFNHFTLSRVQCDQPPVTE